MFKDFFNETSTASITRLTTFMLVCLAIIIQLVNLYIGLSSHGQIVNNIYIPIDTSVMEVFNYATFGILGFGLGAKVVQKFGEKNIDISNLTK